MRLLKKIVLYGALPLQFVCYYAVLISILICCVICTKLNNGGNSPDIRDKQ